MPLFASLTSLACCHVNVTAGSSVLAGGRNAGLNAVFQEITFANQLPTGVQKEILQMKCGCLKKKQHIPRQQQHCTRSAGKQAASLKIISQIRAAVFFFFWSGSQLLLSNGLQPLARCLITRLHRVCCRSDGSAPLPVSPTHWSGSGGTSDWAAISQEFELGLHSCPAVEPSRSAM